MNETLKSLIELDKVYGVQTNTKYRYLVFKDFLDGDLARVTLFRDGRWEDDVLVLEDPIEVLFNTQSINFVKSKPQRSVRVEGAGA